MTEETRKLFEKAARALDAAGTLLRTGSAEFAAGRAYYAMLYTAQALLRERGFAYRKHSAVHSAFGELFAKPALLDPKYHRWLLDAFDTRLKGDYDFDAMIDLEAASTLVTQAREFLEAGRLFVENRPASP